jgi:hypothetical protein
MTDTVRHRAWQKTVNDHMQDHFNAMFTTSFCSHCISGFWCPYHGENPELDEITEVEENQYLRKRVEELEVENVRLKDLRIAASFYVECREKYQRSDISANLTDTYALGKLKQVLKKSWG